MKLKIKISELGKKNLILYSKRTSRKKISNNELDFEFYTTEIDLPSFKRKISLFFYPKNDFFTIEFSIPKFLIGQNVQILTPSHTLLAVHIFIRKIETIVKENIDYNDIEVMRLDLCYAWKLNSEYEIQNFLKLVKKSFNRLEGRVRTYPNGSSVVFNDYSIKFYDKGIEFQKNDYKEISKYNRIYADNLRYLSKNILRFEITFRKRKLKSMFRNKTDLLYLLSSEGADDIENIIKLYFEKVMSFRNELETSVSVFEKLYKEYSNKKAKRLYQFWCTAQNAEYYKTWLENTERTTVWRNLRDLRLAKIGIDDSIELLNFVTIPSILTPFPNPDTLRSDSITTQSVANTQHEGGENK